MDSITVITIYVDNKAHSFDVSINHTDVDTSYLVKQRRVNGEILDLLPETFSLSENGHVISNDLIERVEQKQLVRLIWQEISTNTKGR